MAKELDEFSSELMQMAEEAAAEHKKPVEEKIQEESAEVVEAAKVKEEEKKIDPVEYDWTSLGEGFKSFEDVQKAVPTSLSELKALKAQQTQWEKEKADYAAQLETLKTSSIDDPDLVRLNKLKKENPDDYKLYARVKLVGDVNAIDLLKARLVKKSPSFKDKSDEVDEIIKSKYGMDIDIPPQLTDEDATPEEISQRNREIEAAKKKIRLGKAQLEMDADEYKSELVSKFDSIELPEAKKEVTKEEVEAELGQRKTAWTPIVDKLTEKFEVVSIPGRNEKGELVELIKFTVPKNKVAEYGKQAVDFIVSENMPYENDSIGRAASFLVSRVKSEYEADINFKLMEHGRNMADEEWEKLAHNPSGAGTTENREGNKKLTKYEESIKKAEEMHGV